MTRAQLTGQQTSEWPGGDALERAARYVADVRQASSPGARIRAITSREGARALTDVLRSVPVVPAPFSQAPAGEELRAWFNPARTLPLDRAPVAVLPLPATYADYLRGRPKQALRSNLTRAAQAGLTCADGESPDEVWRSARFIADRRGQRLDDVVLRRPRAGLVRRFAVAYDAAGDPLGLTETIVDGRWAGLAVLVSSHSHPDAQLIRYVLHAHNAAALIGDGVSMLVVGGSMLLTSSGTRYFQRRTGFVPAWVRPTPSPALPSRRRKAAAPTSLTLADLAAAIPAQRAAPADQPLAISAAP